MAMTVSGSLVQVNGAHRSFQASTQRSMAAMVGKLLRRSAWRVMIGKDASARACYEREVGAKRSWTRG